MSSIAAIVRAIRNSTDEGDEFDLAGSMDEAQATGLIKSAFGEPVPANKPLKFTFIVGGGRLVRAKYDQHLTKWLTAALRELGYEDDRGSALGSQGAYKRQADIDANLEYLHVYPKIASKAAAAVGGGGGAGARDDGSASSAGGGAGLNRESPEYMVVACNMDQLKRIVQVKVPTYSSKKRLLGVLQDYDRKLEALDNKMMATAQPLSAAEQEEYDVTTREILAEKIAFVQGEMKAQVSTGKLTSSEKERVLHGMDEKLQAMKAELAAATSAGQAKKVTSIQAAIDQLAARQASVASSAAIVHPVKGDVDMKKCEIGMANCDRLAANIKKAGRLATIAEARELGMKSDFEEKLAQLRKDARTWFESEEEFEERFAAAMKALAAKMRR